MLRIRQFGSAMKVNVELSNPAHAQKDCSALERYVSCDSCFLCLFGGETAVNSPAYSSHIEIYGHFLYCLFQNSVC